MPLRKQPDPVAFLGSSVPWGGSIIHFYYSPAEQARGAVFLADALAAEQGAILGCTIDAYQVMAEALAERGVAPSDRRLVRVEISANLSNSIYAVASAVQQGSAKGKPVRVLVDFDNIVPQENLGDAEASLSATLQGLNVVSLTQYDGRAFAAPVTLEQFRTHALAVVGNVLHHENRDYTRPEKYFRYRTAAGQR